MPSNKVHNSAVMHHNSLTEIRTTPKATTSSKGLSKKSIISTENSEISQSKLSKGKTKDLSAGKISSSGKTLIVRSQKPETKEAITDMTYDPPCVSFIDMVAADLDDYNEINETSASRMSNKSRYQHKNDFNELLLV